MKKTVSTITVSALILAASILPASANGKNSKKMPSISAAQKGPHQMEHFAQFGNQELVMGTISFIDTSKSIVDVKNVDGNVTHVHINPETKIMRSFKNFARHSDESQRQPLELSITDLKLNTWVSVAKFNTNTNIVEASLIRAPIDSDSPRRNPPSSSLNDK